MVEIVSGNQLGLVNSSLPLLGSGGGVGSAQLGKNGDQIYLNAATGNLIIENTDEALAAAGSDLSLVRAYNSQGLMNDENGDNWRLSVDRRVYGLTGTVNTAGSTITKQFGDGTEVVYTYNTTLGLYVAKDGSNANDTFSYNASSLQWTWQNGSTSAKELYNSTGQMVQSSDINNNTTVYTYTGSQLTQIVDASGQTTHLDYTGNNLTDIRVFSGGVTQTRTQYTYDSSNRLSTVVIDLSPADNSTSDGNTYTTTYTYDGTSDRVASITSGDGTTVSFTYTLINGLYRVATYQDGDGNISTLSYSAPSTSVGATPIDLLARASALSTTVPPYYTVPNGATWASVVLAVYGSSDTAAASALQTAMGNPTLATGLQLTVPVMFTYTPATSSKAVYEQTTITNPLGQVTTVKADSSGRVVAVQTPSVGSGPLETDYTYDASGNVATITDDPAGRHLVTIIQYDANGNVVLRRDAAGNTVTSTYSSKNQLLTQTTYTVPDPSGSGVTASSGPQTTRYAYDDRGNLRFVVSPQGLVTEYRYDAAGNRITQIRYQSATIDLSSLTASTAITHAQMVGWAVSEAQAQVPVQRTDYAYDFRGNLTSTTTYSSTAATGGATGPTNLSGADIGTTGAAGSSTVSGSAVTVNGAGADVAGTADAFQFDSEALNGDGTITARVVSQTNTNASARAGVMIRESNAAGAQFVFVDLTPGSGWAMQSRTGTNASAMGLSGTGVAAPYWVRLTRAGNTFTGFISADGTTWTQVNQVVVPMATSVLAGLAVTSHVAGTLSTAVFDNVSVAGGSATPPAGAAVAQYVYDQRGQLLQTIDPRGYNTVGQYLTTYTYDGLGRPLSTVRWTASGNVTTATELYSGSAKTASVTLANGLVTTSTYDAAGRLLSIAESNGGTALGTTSYAYDAAGELRRVTDPIGVTTDYIYDASGRKAFTIDGAGQLTQYIYDQTNNLVETIKYAGLANKTLLSDSNGNPLASVNTASLIASAETNSASDIVTRSVYDSANRLAYSIDAAGSVIAYTYDGASRLISTVEYATPFAISRSVGVIGYTPGSINGTTLSTSSDDRLTRQFYDADGHLVGTLDADGYLIKNVYDSAGELSQTIKYARPTDATIRVSGTLAQLVPTVDPAHDQTTYYFYDGVGRQSGTLDAEGYLTQKIYDTAGNLVQVIRYPNPVSFTGTPTLAAVLPSSTAGAHITSYTYDELNHVTQETDYEGTVTTYQYDPVGNLLTKTLAAATTDSQIYRSQYDALGRITASLSPVGAAQITNGMTPAQINAIWSQYQTTYAYDADGHLISTTDPAGDTTHFYYDADGRQRFVINARGEVSETRYNALGQISDNIAYVNRVSAAGLTGGPVTAAVTNLVNGVANPAADSHETFSYGLNGQVSSKSTAEGANTTYSYDAFGDIKGTVTAITSTASQVTSYTYDARGDLKKTETGSTGVIATVQKQYDAFGRQTSATDADNNSTSYEYDRIGRTVLVTDPLSGKQITTYDAFSRTLTMVDARNQTTTYQYSDSSRSVTVTTPEGVSVTTTHTRNGQTASVANQATTVYYVYDAAGSVLRKYDSTGNLGVDTYDTSERLSSTTDANGVVTQIEYYAASRVFTRTVDPNGLNLVTTYQYDGEGRTTQTTDEKGVITTTGYDRDGRVLTVTVDPNGPLNIQTTYSYDLRGGLTVATVGAGSTNPQVTTYTYDALGRRTTDSVALGLGQGNALTQYFYDAAGNMTRRIDANINSTWYIYDADNRTAVVVDALGGVTQNTYDPAGNLTSTRRYATAIPTAGFGNTVTLSQITLPAVSSTDRVDQKIYDNDGRVAYTIDAALGVTKTVYDNVGNVVETIAYANPLNAGTYSTVGDVSSHVVADPLNDHTIRYVYDSRGQRRFTIDALGYVTQTVYDPAGNVVQTTAYAKQSTISGIPAIVDMTGWVSGNTGSADRTTRYWYDAMGRQVLMLDAANYITRTIYNDAARTKQTIGYSRVQTIAAGATATQAIQAIATSPSDKTTTDAYDAAGRLATETDSLGHTQQWQYDAVGNKIQYTNQNGAVWTYVYDANHRVIEEHSPSVAVTTVSNSSSALTAAAPVSTSLVTRLAYDAVGNVLSRTEAYGRLEARMTSYQYDALGRQTLTIYPQTSVYSGTSDINPFASTVAPTVTSANPQQSVTYNTLGDAVMSVDVGGGISHKAYDQLGRVTYEVDALNNVTQHAYDAFGNETSLSRYSAPLNSGLTAGVPWTASDIAGHIKFTSSDDRTTTKSYDDLNRVVQIKQPSVFNYLPAAGSTPGGTNILGSATTLYDYDAFGGVTRMRQLADSPISPYADTYYYYDSRGLLVATVDAGGFLTTQAYDSRGNLTNKVEYATALSSPPTTPSASQPSPPDPTSNDRVHTYTYDALNRKLTEMLVGLSASTTSGNSVTTTPTNQTTTYTYDNVGNLISQSDALGNATYTYYDALGRVVAVAQPAENTGASTLIPLVTMGRDAFGDLTSQTQYAAGASTATATGYTAAPTPAATSAVSFSWTVAGSSFATTATLGYRLSGTSTYSYVTPVLNGSTFSATLAMLPPGTYDFTYTTVQRVRKGGDTTTSAATGQFTVSGNSATLNSQTVTAGSPTAVGVTALVNQAQNRITFMQYDVDGHVVATQDPNGNLRQASYDKSGNLVKQWLNVANANDGSTESIVTVNQYDLLNQLVRVETSQTADGSQIAVTDSVYNAFGEVTQKGTYAAGTPNPTLQERYTYDQAGRLWLTNSGDGVYKVYEYDLMGNTTAVITSQNYDLSGVASAQAALNLPPANQMRQETRYDLLGHAVEQRSATFSAATTLEPIQGNFGFGALPIPNQPNAIYQAQTARQGKGGTYTYYVVNPTTWANGGGYYQVSAPSAANPQGVYQQVAQTSYQLLSHGCIFWDLPSTLGITANFTYSGTSSGSLTVNQLTATQDGVDISSLPSGTYTYTLTYTRSTDSTPYAEATGTFTVTNSVVTSLVSGATPPPNAAVTFSWTDATGVSTSDFTYYASGTTSYVAVPTTQNGGSFTAALGVLAPGTYNYVFNTYRHGGKAGLITISSVTGTFTVANGAVTLGSATISVGTPTNIAVSGSIPAVATPTVSSVASGSGAVVSWAQTTVGSTAKLEIQQGSGAWTSYTGTLSGSTFSATIPSLSTGAYNYRVTEISNGEIVALGAGTLTDSPSTTTVSGVTSSGANTLVAPISGSESSIPGSPDVTVNWSSTANGSSADLYYGPSGSAPGTYVTPTVTGTTTVPGTTTVTGVTQNTATNPLYVAPLSGSTVTNFGNPNVGFTWASAGGTSGTFGYEPTTSSTFTNLTPTVANGVFSVSIGLLDAGTYNVQWTSSRRAGKGGAVTTGAGTGTITVANGVATLTSSTVTTGTGTNIGVTGTAGGGTNTTAIQWARPSDTAVTASFGYRVSGSGAGFTMVTPSVGGTVFSLSLINLPAGTYDFEAFNIKGGATIDQSNGTFTLTSSSISFSSQAHTAPASFANVSFSGANLTWTQAPAAGDSITVTAVSSSGVATTLTPLGSGSSWSASVASLNATGTYTYTINYYPSGSGSPYVQATGSFTTNLSAPVTYNNWSAHIGVLAPGAYAIAFDTTRTSGKVGTITVMSGTGTFTANSDGSAGLTSETVTTGTLLSISASGVSTATTYTTTIQWARPSDSTVYASFGYRVSGSGAGYTTLTPAAASSTFVATLQGLAFGTYDYTASDLKDVAAGKGGTVTSTLDTSTGQFTVSSSGVTFLGQSHATPTSITAVSSSGSSLTWTQAANSTDTVTASVTSSSNVTTTLTISGSSPSYGASLAGLAAGNYTYTINYVASGQSAPYLQGTGFLTVTTTPVTVTASTSTGVGGISAFLDGLSSILYWANPASTGSTVTFQYRQLGDTTWAGTRNVAAHGTGFQVDLSALSGTIEYEVTYTASNQTTPYIVANGRTTINRAGTTSASLADTTSTTLAPVSTTPTVEQTYDRWGDVLTVADASHNTTTYSYDQLGDLTQVTLPQTSILSTAGGTITPQGLVSATQQNYYDVLGRLIGKRDGDGNLNTETYNSNGQELREDHADGGWKQFVYDGFGDQIQITEAATNSTSYRTRMAYDDDGKLIETAREIAAGTFATNNASDLTAANNTGVVEYHYTYDSAGRRTSASNGQLGSSGVLGTVQYWYDQQGHVVKSKTPLGSTETYTYDLRGNKATDVDSLGGTQSWTYSYFGQLQTHTDLGGSVTTNTYNLQNDSMLTQTTSTIGGVAAGNITYFYDAAGHLINIHDRGAAAAGGLAAVVRDTTYAYDSAGRQSRDTVVIDSLTHSDTQISYDQQNRIAQLSDLSYRDNYSYDAAGNRTLIQASYFDYSGALKTQSLYYTYDSMNRVLISQGANVGNSVAVNTDQGVQLTYDYMGDRLSAYQYGQVIEYNSATSTWSYGSAYGTQNYTYDGLGDLLTTKSTELIDGTASQVATDSRVYDKAQRVTQETSYSLDTSASPVAPVNRLAITTYDADGRVATQLTYNNNNPESFVVYGESANTAATSQTVTNPFTGGTVTVAWSGAWTSGFDAAGNLRGYIEEVFTSSGTLAYSSTDSMSYRNGSSYQETGESISSSAGGPQSGATTYTYNVDGQLVSFADTRDVTKDRYFADDSNGNSLTVVQGDFDGTSGRLAAALAFQQALTDTGGYNASHSQRFFFALGQQVGSFGQLTDNGTFSANFDVNYTPVSQRYPADTPAEVVAQQGDTLKSIAARIYGDPNLWYIIAQANGLTDPNAPQTSGVVLRIPNSVVSLSNSANSYKPYSAAQAIGDTTPTQPIPPPQASSGGGGCGILGEILVIVVTIVVAYYTAGAASGWIAGLQAEATAAAATTAVSTTATVVGAAIGGAVGSIAGQAVGIATGIQKGFNWNQVAISAIGAGVGSGLGIASGGANGLFSSLGTYGQAAAIAATDQIVTQGISVALGLQHSFDWTAVATAAISAPLAMAANKGITELNSTIGSSDLTDKLVVGASSALVRSTLGGKFNTVAVLTDAFAQYLGDSLEIKTNTAEAAQQGSSGTTQDAPANSGQPPAPAPVANNPAATQDLLVTAPPPVVNDVPPPPVSSEDGEGYAAAGAAGAAGSGQVGSPAGSGSQLPEVTVTARHWTWAEELEYQRLISSPWSVRADGRFGGGMAGASEEDISRQARFNVAHDARIDYSGPAGFAGAARDMQLMRLFTPMNQVAAGEALLTAGTGLVGTIANGYVSMAMGPDTGKSVQNALTYSPRLQITKDLFFALSPVADALDYTRTGLGDATYSLTGSPALSAAAFTVPDAVATLFFPEGRGAFASAGSAAWTGGKEVAFSLGQHLDQAVSDYLTRSGLQLNVVPTDISAGVKLGLQMLDPTTVSFTQSSVSFAKAGASYNLDTLVRNMSTDGWVGKPIDVVAMPDGTLASIDNTRVLAARQAGIDVQANVRGFDEAITDPVRQLSLTEKGNVPDTWGDAALLRINKPIQNATYPGMNPGWSVRFPYGSIYDPVVKY